MAAAISAGAAGIRVFGSLEDVRAAAAVFKGEKLLAGEVDALPPDGFDLGNSASDFTAERCGGKTILMSTTNGTKALVASTGAKVLLTGSLANAAATAAVVVQAGLPVTMVCSGTQGEVSFEDLVGCGAVMEAMGEITLENDTAMLARIAWQSARDNLSAVFRETFSGHNLARVKLLPDLDFCTKLNRYDLACRVYLEADGLVVRRADA